MGRLPYPKHYCKHIAVVPIGAVLTLGANATDVNFSTRLIEGVNSECVNRDAEILILDGQQRLTALFQSLMLEEPSTENISSNEDIRYYYLDMKLCLRNEIERETAVLSCGGDFQLQTSRGKIIDLSGTINHFSPEKEYTNDVFPLRKIFDAATWRRGYFSHWPSDTAKMELFDTFEGEVIERFKQYNVPVIHLRSETPREAVCLVFEKVNTRGVTLTVFELLTAMFAASGYRLRVDWENREERLKRHPVLKGLESTNFLRALTLLVTNANSNAVVSCARRDILRLTVESLRGNGPTELRMGL